MVVRLGGEKGARGIADRFFLEGRSGSAHAVRAEAVETSPELVSKHIFWVESPLDSTTDRTIHRGRFPN
jgi:hypothetical protein